MKAHKVTDEEILFDLEYRGIDEFLSKLDLGIEVPKCFVPRVKKIIKKYYDIDLIENSLPFKKIVKGHFCSMKYEDEIKILTRVKMI